MYWYGRLINYKPPKLPISIWHVFHWTDICYIAKHVCFIFLHAESSAMLNYMFQACVIPSPRLPGSRVHSICANVSCIKSFTKDLPLPMIYVLFFFGFLHFDASVVQQLNLSSPSQPPLSLSPPPPHHSPGLLVLWRLQTLRDTLRDSNELFDPSLNKATTLLKPSSFPFKLFLKEVTKPHSESSSRSNLFTAV